MNDSSPIHTQPEPKHLARAGDILEAILLSDLDLDARICVGITVAQLYDVYPPYEPHPPITEAIAFQTGIPLAIEALAAAAEASDAIPELLRFGIAARELRELRDQR